MTTTAELSENSHQGFEGLKAALCLAEMEAKSNTALGMPVYLRRNGIGSRSSSKERDAETGLDWFESRYLSSAQGRFLSPDNPKFSEKLDPQSWNLYSYVGNNPMVRVDPLGHNWFDFNGNWQWYAGADIDSEGKSCKKGSKGCHHSDYTHLIVIKKTGERLGSDGGEEVGVFLYGNADPKTTPPIEKKFGFSGSLEFNFRSTPNGNYEINLNVRGGPESEHLAWDGSLAAFPGIQQLGWFQENGVQRLAQGAWGDYRANLLDMQTGAPTHYYRHGKQDHFSGTDWTHGCTATPYQKVLRKIFSLDPRGVGEGAKNGRIAVSVGR